MNILIIMNSINVKLGGGIIQVILNYKEALEKQKVNVTYAINCAKGTEIPELLTSKYSKFVELPNKKKNIFKYCLKISKLLYQNDFDVIHVHGNSANMLLELGLAKVFGVKTRIAHSHNSTCKYPLFNKLIQPIFRKTYTKGIACSTLAGEWLFGKNNFNILNNSIKIDNFLFSNNVREQYRKRLNIDNDTIVMGHVGNINEQKNHEFLIEIFKKFHKQVPNSILILIGDGHLRNKIEENIKLNGIEDFVKILGMRTDVNCWFQAMDIFVFPSKWEGFGIVLLEAQVAGLPVVASNVIPEAAIINDNVHVLDLKFNTLDDWLIRIKQSIAEKKDRKIDRKKFEEYDIDMQSKKLLHYYIG